MKILVTGGAGYIGSHACKAVAQANHLPVVYDNLSTGHPDFVKWGPLEVGDIRDKRRLGEALDLHRPDLVMHFAALAYVGESVQQPAKYYDVNVNGTRMLLEAMLEAGVQRIVFSSSCATYGIPEAVPIEEGMPQQPINPYGFTKLAAERMLADFESAYGLQWVALRYFNAAGADPEGEVGEAHDPETHAIPLALEAALGHRDTFSLFGDDYATPDGSAVRDYVHVSDLADAHVRAADYLAAGGQPIAFNLATGGGTSVLELVNAIERISGCKVPLTRASRRPGDPPELYASALLARDVLGWDARHSSIDDIVETALAWMRRTCVKLETPSVLMA